MFAFDPDDVLPPALKTVPPVGAARPTGVYSSDGRMRWSPLGKRMFGDITVSVLAWRADCVFPVGNGDRLVAIWLMSSFAPRLYAGFGGATVLVYSATSESPVSRSEDCLSFKTSPGDHFRIDIHHHHAAPQVCSRFG